MNIIEKIKENSLGLEKIPKEEQTRELCEIAIKQNPLTIKFANAECLDCEICEFAVNQVPELIKFVPDNFKTKEICLIAVKNNVNTFGYIPVEKRIELFDDKTDIELIKKIVDCRQQWLRYAPNRADVRALCIRYMENDFSISRFMPDEIKTSEDILEYQKAKGKLRYKNKFYDLKDNVFKVRIDVLYEYIGLLMLNIDNIEEESYSIEVKFNNFDDFYDFVDADISGAYLRDYDFEGIDLNKYNIEGAVIKGEILQAQGLYDDTYFQSIKSIVNDYTNDVIESNEVLIADNFYYPKPVDDNGYDRGDINHIPFFYISDIHLVQRVWHEFNEIATKEEIEAYICYLARAMVSSVGSRPRGSYLLIAGDTSTNYELSVIFYSELVKIWDSRHIVVISGNHELCDPYVDMEKNIKAYRKLFKNLGIAYLQNDVLCIFQDKKSKIIPEAKLQEMDTVQIRDQVQKSSVIILGGIGFSGLDKEFNASNAPFGKSFDKLNREEMVQKDIQEAKRFNAIYKKLLESINTKKVIVLTHIKKSAWNEDEYNPNWIYINGHDHRNFYEVNENWTIYADNQIGYRGKNIGLKFFYCDNVYDTFEYYKDGIYEITKEQYIEFNKGKLVSMTFNRKDGIIYMLKKNFTYMFFLYINNTKSSEKKLLYLLNGGKIAKLKYNDFDDLDYYFENLEEYVKNINQLSYKFLGGQKKLSEFIRRLGGSGKIHGCIVDIDRPSLVGGFSMCHLFFNPIDGKITPYFAEDVKSRIVYKDLKTLLQSHSRCKLIADNYLQLEKEFTQNLPMVRYSGELEEWQNEDQVNDKGSYIYKLSNIIKSLQYCTEKGIIRIWNENLLNYEFILEIEHTQRIDDNTYQKLTE